MKAALGGGSNGPVGTLIGDVTNGANSGPGGPGGELSSPNLNNTLLGWLGDSATALGDVVTNLSNYTLSLAEENQTKKDETAIAVAGILAFGGALYFAAPAITAAGAAGWVAHSAWASGSCVTARLHLNSLEPA